MNLVTNDGHKVYYSAYHLKVHADVCEYLEEAISTINTHSAPFIKVAVQFDKIIGQSTCVNVRNGDEFKYAKRIGRKYPTRFVLNREPEPCSTVTVIMKRTPNSDKYGYTLLTAYIGGLATKEVHDPKLTYEEAHEAHEFWNSHALIWDESIIEQTA
ncbi:hypothetical protein pEaSNUABM44_00377 [Erwinia phage pEa_SNUABM_44]|nr:hypothetical protein pEaSNUABM44_00377 [Erwinia phage pEa_SNUABM_44]